MTIMRKLYVSSLLIGAMYLIAGIVAIVNWSSMLLGIEPILSIGYIPPDAGFALVMITIGITMIAAAYFRDNIAKCLACALVGSGLGIASAFIQIAVTLAVGLDVIITWEEGDVLGTIFDVLREGIIRADVVLGLPALVLFMMSYRALKRLL